MKSLFITFEGIEGAGKSTQMRLLRDLLTLRKYAVVMTREPGGTPIGDQIRHILLAAKNRQMDPLCELFLYAAARAQHVEEIIRPALAAGSMVLCDRFIDATYAYQGTGRGFSRDALDRIHALMLQGLMPDCTFLLDCAVETGLERALARMGDSPEGEREDRFERESRAFHEQVRQGYLQRAKADPKRMHIIDANGDVETVHREIAKIVLKLL